MRKTLALLACLFALPAMAHGPTPIKVDDTIAIAADPEAVWALAGKFDGLAAWHPDVQSVKAKGGDATGAEREVKLKKGGVLKEGLDEYDAVAHRLGWRMSDPDLDALPVSSYSLSFSVEPAAGGGSKVKWYGRLYRGDTSNEPPDNLNDDAARTAMAAYLHNGLEGLKKKVEGR